MRRVNWRIAVVGTALVGVAAAQQPTSPVGATPPANAMPRVEFAFEARVTLAPPTVLGDTDVGYRQYIPITGGTVSGPKFRGVVIPGGWDYQLRTAGGCNSLTADYFLRAADGTVIHILNQGLLCPDQSPAAAGRTYLTPRIEAPKGPHQWLTRATFVATLELERATPTTAGGQGELTAVRIRFYQVM